jgi:hypothetical protein
MSQLEDKNQLLPRDGHKNGVQLVPAIVPFATTKDTSISTSTEITLNANTGIIEVQAIDDNVYLRYGTDDVTTVSNGFHEFIPAGATRHYALPKGITAINLIDDGNGATVIVIEK